MSSQELRQRGSTSVEYVAATSVVLALLFLPLSGESGSVVSIVLESFKHFQAHSLYLLSMP